MAPQAHTSADGTVVPSVYTPSPPKKTLEIGDFFVFSNIYIIYIIVSSNKLSHLNRNSNHTRICPVTWC